MDNELINYCISEVAYSIYKFWLKNINNKIKGTSLDLRNYFVSSIKYKAVLMTEIQTANENENENEISQKNLNWQMVIQFQNPNKLLMPLMIFLLALATGGY